MNDMGRSAILSFFFIFSFNCLFAWFYTILNYMCKCVFYIYTLIVLHINPQQSLKQLQNR
jgi:hypothetical protein